MLCGWWLYIQSIGSGIVILVGPMSVCRVCRDSCLKVCWKNVVKFTKCTEHTSKLFQCFYPLLDHVTTKAPPLRISFCVHTGCNMITGIIQEIKTVYLRIGTNIYI